MKIQEESEAEIVRHCNILWQMISIVPPDPIAIAQANLYLDDLQASDYPMYDVVMQLLAKAKGMSWRALKDNM